MHIFLYGSKQIGKSTVIQNVISELNTTMGGFITYPGIDSDRNIYISSILEPRKYEDSNRVGIRNNQSAIGVSDSFNEIGVDILRSSKSCNLLCMDELGFLEQDATNFINEVIKCLDEPIPILGVIKDTPIPWQDIIKSHPKVELILITKENRNEIVPVIIDKLKINN